MAVAASKSLDDISAQHQQQQHLGNNSNSVSHQELDKDQQDDLSDLISAFGISPDAGRRRQRESQHIQRQVGKYTPFKIVS